MAIPKPTLDAQGEPFIKRSTQKQESVKSVKESGVSKILCYCLLTSVLTGFFFCLFTTFCFPSSHHSDRKEQQDETTLEGFVKSYAPSDKRVEMAQCFETVAQRLASGRLSTIEEAKADFTAESLPYLNDEWKEFLSLLEGKVSHEKDSLASDFKTIALALQGGKSAEAVVLDQVQKCVEEMDQRLRSLDSQQNELAGKVERFRSEQNERARETVRDDLGADQGASGGDLGEEQSSQGRDQRKDSQRTESEVNAGHAQGGCVNGQCQVAQPVMWRWW